MLDLLPKLVDTIHSISASEPHCSQKQTEEISSSLQKALFLEYFEDATNFVSEMVTLDRSSPLTRSTIIESSTFQGAYQNVVKTISTCLQEMQSPVEKQTPFIHRMFVPFTTKEEHLAFSKKLNQASPHDISILALQVFWRGIPSLINLSTFNQSSPTFSDRTKIEEQANRVYVSIAKQEPISWESCEGYFKEDSILNYDLHISNAHNKHKLKQFQEALTHLKEALLAYKKVFPLNARELGSLYNNLGCTLSSLERHTEALPYLKKALPILQTTLPSDAKELGSLYYDAGNTLYKLERYREALPHLKKALVICTKDLPPNAKELKSLYFFLGETLYILQRYQDALPYFEQALLIFQKSFPPNTKELGIVYFHLGNTLYFLERYQEALPLLQKALPIFQEIFSQNGKQLAPLYRAVGHTLTSLQRHQEAFFYLKRVSSIDESPLSTIETSALKKRKSEDSAHPNPTKKSHPFSISL